MKRTGFLIGFVAFSAFFVSYQMKIAKNTLPETACAFPLSGKVTKNEVLYTETQVLNYTYLIELNKRCLNFIVSENEQEITSKLTLTD